VESDEDILEAAAAGNASRVASLILARHGAALYGQARCLVDAATADDVMQDALLSIVEALVAGEFKRKASLRSYAVSVVRYTAFHCRRSFWYGVLHRRAVVPDVLDEVPVAEPELETSSEQISDDERLARCLAQLGAETRVVIAMRLEGRSHAEIAKVLGISRAKSEQLCSRGVRRCQELLRDGDDE
jgi:RNA polymerase sigma factor (sigma-70 family)